MRRRGDLTGLELLGWAALGAAAGVVAGFLLAEWVGGVDRQRLERAARRARERPPRPRLSAAAGARAARAALSGDPELRGFALEANPVACGVVELRGWVPTRAARAHAGRIARAVPGIETVVNSILVRGEDDRSPAGGYLATDQSA